MRTPGSCSFYVMCTAWSTPMSRCGCGFRVRVNRCEGCGPPSAHLQVQTSWTGVLSTLGSRLPTFVHHTTRTEMLAVSAAASNVKLDGAVSPRAGSEAGYLDVSVSRLWRGMMWLPYATWGGEDHGQPSRAASTIWWGGGGLRRATWRKRSRLSGSVSLARG